MTVRLTSWAVAQHVRLNATGLLAVAQTVEKIAEYASDELADATWEALLPKVREHIDRMQRLLDLQ